MMCLKELWKYNLGQKFDIIAQEQVFRGPVLMDI